MVNREIRPMDDRPYTRKDIEEMLERMERLAKEYEEEEKASKKE